MNKFEIAKRIDHTILKSNAVETEIKKLCDEAKNYNFASVCVNPYFVPFVSKELLGTEVQVCTVIGFPLGSNCTEIKVKETELAVKHGASEVDMVINIGALKAGVFNCVEEDIISVVKASGNAIVKVIIETCYLTDEEKRQMCKIIKNAGADFIKTSTGFGSSGATVEDIKLFKKELGDSLRIKASGGIRSLSDALIMINAGADRIGTSSGVKIISEIN